MLPRIATLLAGLSLTGLAQAAATLSADRRQLRRTADLCPGA